MSDLRRAVARTLPTTVNIRVTSASRSGMIGRVAADSTDRGIPGTVDSMLRQVFADLCSPPSCDRAIDDGMASLLDENGTFLEELED